ncbi:hypothetical protein N7457_004605 [Penicillium paradoxum]|uniref:uncharacterized protein n=1 Tax=Penicillium paradoxum TaxID=176176 RepID=UPI0025497C75|nr:uncharacterized protein N7457_004605 [Penicillium paradoxum]KAJ5782831.1 hypothetical protein N7457_004605 [Penicillium paradoxum]
MLSTNFLLASAAALTLSGLANAQTNITEKDCASTSEYSKCNRDVADKWSSCIKDCRGDGNCIVDCGCESHQKYINCMAESCWNQVYSCKYQLFVQQYFAVCPSAKEPIPFWPAPNNAPNRCSCDLAKITQRTLSSRNEQIKCMNNVTNNISDDISKGPDLSNLSNGLDIANRASDCACCGASASISAHVGTLLPPNLPNLYTSLPNWAWSSCDANMKDTKCQDLGFKDAGKFYKPGEFPDNGTSTLYNVGGTVTAPPSGTVLTWSQASATYTVTATGYDREAVVSQDEYRATATGTGAFATQTSESGGAGGRGVGIVGAVVGAAFAVVMF